MKNNELTKSLENYLQAVYEIVSTKQAARVKDVSNYLDLGASSTSDAIKALCEKKYINYEPYGIITLTSKGKNRIEQKIKRYEKIYYFLTEVLLIEDETALLTAKHVEYSFPEEVLEKFVGFVTFMKNCSCKKPAWIKSFQHFATQGKMKDCCTKCQRTGVKGCDCSECNKIDNKNNL